jgi:hypothetical protein
MSLILVLFFAIVCLIGFKNIKDKLIKIAYGVHSFSILLFFITPKYLFYSSSDQFLEPMALVILVHAFLTAFLLLFNFKYINKFKIKSTLYFNNRQIIFSLLLFYLLFYFSVFNSLESIFKLRTADFNNSFLMFDVIRYLLISFVSFNVVLTLYSKDFYLRLIYLFLLFFGLALLLSFGSRNNLVYVMIPVLFYIFNNKKYKYFILIIPLVFIFNFITLNRDSGVINENKVNTSWSISHSFNSLDNLKTLKKIYYQSDIFYFSQHPLKLSFDFYLAIIPTYFFDYLDLEKNTHKTFTDWNSINVEVGNETPSYLGQIILQNGFLGFLFYPLNFLLIIIPACLFIRKISMHNELIFYSTFLSLFIGGIFNFTRFISFGYFGPFWFFAILLFLIKKIK